MSIITKSSLVFGGIVLVLAIISNILIAPGIHQSLLVGYMINVIASFLAARYFLKLSSKEPSIKEIFFISAESMVCVFILFMLSEIFLTGNIDTATTKSIYVSLYVLVVRTVFVSMEVFIVLLISYFVSFKILSKKS